MDPNALELMRLLQSEAHDAATLATVRERFAPVQASLTRAGDAAAQGELRGLLEAWAQAAPPAERAEALVFAAGLAEGAERARLLRVVGQLRLEQTGDVDGAIAVYEEALDADADVTLTRELADLYALRNAAGDGERAADLYAAVAELLGGEDAVALLDKALGLAPGHTEALALLEAATAESERPAKLRERWEAYVSATADEAGAAERRLVLARVDGAAERFRDALLWIAPLVDRGDPAAQKLKETFLAGLARTAPVASAASEAVRVVDRPLPARALSPRSGQTMVGFKVPGTGAGDATLEAVERARRALEVQGAPAEEQRPPRQLAGRPAQGVPDAVAGGAVLPTGSAHPGAGLKATLVGVNPYSGPLMPTPRAIAVRDPLAATPPAPAPVRDPLAHAAAASSASAGQVAPTSPTGGFVSAQANVTKQEFSGAMLAASPLSAAVPAERVSGVAATMPAIVVPPGLSAGLAPGHPSAGPFTASAQPGTAPGLGGFAVAGPAASSVSAGAMPAAPVVTASWPPVPVRASMPHPKVAPGQTPGFPAVQAGVAAPAGGSPSGRDVLRLSDELADDELSLRRRPSIPIILRTLAGLRRPSAVRAPYLEDADLAQGRQGAAWSGRPLFVGAGIVLAVGVLFLVFSGGDDDDPSAAPAPRSSSVPAVEAPTTSTAAPSPTLPPAPTPSPSAPPAEPGAAEPSEPAPAAPEAAPSEATAASSAASGSTASSSGQPSTLGKTPASSAKTTVGSSSKTSPATKAVPNSGPEPDPLAALAEGAPSAGDIVPDAPPTSTKPSSSIGKGKASVDLATGPAGVKGGKLTVSAVVAALQPKLGALRRCYDKALDRNGKLEGRVMLEWPVKSGGRVGTVKKISGTTLKDTKLIRCESEVVKGTKFPETATQVRMGFDHMRKK